MVESFWQRLGQRLDDGRSCRRVRITAMTRVAEFTNSFLASPQVERIAEAVERQNARFMNSDPVLLHVEDARFDCIQP